MKVLSNFETEAVAGGLEVEYGMSFDGGGGGRGGYYFESYEIAARGDFLCRNYQYDCSQASPDNTATIGVRG